MTQEELTKLLMESYKRGQSDLIKSCHETISIAVHTAILAEREACAKLCFEMWEKWMDADPSKRDNLPRDAEDCANAIRARGQE
jgi:aspartokinase